MLMDLAGRRFGRFIVLRRVENRGHHVYWACRCDCGNEREVSADRLRDGGSASCGCYKIERTIATNTRHGHSRSPQRRSGTYKSWANMIQRTTNPNVPRWADWGGRGITVCERWRDFATFLTDMGERPEGMSLDRIDNDGDYEPGNARWATAPEQAFNRRKRKVAV